MLKFGTGLIFGKRQPMVFCQKQAENRLLILRHHLNEVIVTYLTNGTKVMLHLTLDPLHSTCTTYRV